jgi:hypothetical protein
LPLRFAPVLEVTQDKKAVEVAITEFVRLLRNLVRRLWGEASGHITTLNSFGRSRNDASHLHGKPNRASKGIAGEVPRFATLWYHFLRCRKVARS